MALDGYTDLNVSRQAVKAELPDAGPKTGRPAPDATCATNGGLHRLITAHMRLAISRLPGAVAGAHR